MRVETRDSEKLHLDRAVMASSAHELTYVPVHCQYRCLQGLRIPGPACQYHQPARAPGLALGTDRPAQAGQRNNLSHNTECRAQGPDSQSQGVHRRAGVAADARRPAAADSDGDRHGDGKRGAADGKRPPARVERSAAEGQCEIQSNLLKL